MLILKWEEAQLLVLAFRPGRTPNRNVTVPSSYPSGTGRQPLVPLFFCTDANVFKLDRSPDQTSLPRMAKKTANGKTGSPLPVAVGYLSS